MPLIGARIVVFLEATCYMFLRLASKPNYAKVDKLANRGIFVRNFILYFAVALTLTMLSNSPTAAESVPISSMPTYEKFRADLIKIGWIPDFNYGIKNDDGSPSYIYPEVICGNEICSAQWIAKSDRKRLVVVLWMDSNGGYRVAPQLEFPD